VNRPQRQDVLALLREVRAHPLGEHLILGGSSGLYGVSETIPALTEDVDLLIDADWVAAAEAELLDGMQRLGFRHLAGTCTFVAPSGLSLDLVGYSRQDLADRIGGSAAVPVMVFGDLSRLLAAPGSTVELPGGGRALSPAALAVAKLLTIRLEKGAKDKLQALLVLEENAQDETFHAEVVRLLSGFEEDRVADALSDARTAALTITQDALQADPQARGYSEMAQAVARGFDVLARLLDPPAGERR
jgi:hypothetical protein